MRRQQPNKKQQSKSKDQQGKKQKSKIKDSTKIKAFFAQLLSKDSVEIFQGAELSYIKISETSFEAKLVSLFAETIIPGISQISLVDNKGRNVLILLSDAARLMDYLEKYPAVFPNFCRENMGNDKHMIEVTDGKNMVTFSSAQRFRILCEITGNPPQSSIYYTVVNDEKQTICYLVPAREFCWEMVLAYVTFFNTKISRTIVGNKTYYALACELADQLVADVLNIRGDYKWEQYTKKINKLRSILESYPHLFKIQYDVGSFIITLNSMLIHILNKLPIFDVGNHNDDDAADNTFELMIPISFKSLLKVTDETFATVESDIKQYDVTYQVVQNFLAKLNLKFHSGEFTMEIEIGCENLIMYFGQPYEYCLRPLLEKLEAKIYKKDQIAYAFIPIKNIEKPDFDLQAMNELIAKRQCLQAYLVSASKVFPELFSFHFKSEMGKNFYDMTMQDMEALGVARLDEFVIKFKREVASSIRQFNDAEGAKYAFTELFKLLSIDWKCVQGNYSAHTDNIMHAGLVKCLKINGMKINLENPRAIVFSISEDDMVKLSKADYASHQTNLSHWLRKMVIVDNAVCQVRDKNALKQRFHHDGIRWEFKSEKHDAIFRKFCADARLVKEGDYFLLTYQACIEMTLDEVTCNHMAREINPPLATAADKQNKPPAAVKSSVAFHSDKIAPRTHSRAAPVSGKPEHRSSTKKAQQDNRLANDDTKKKNGGGAAARQGTTAVSSAVAARSFINKFGLQDEKRGMAIDTPAARYVLVPAPSDGAEVVVCKKPAAINLIEIDNIDNAHDGAMVTEYNILESCSFWFVKNDLETSASLSMQLAYKYCTLISGIRFVNSLYERYRKATEYTPVTTDDKLAGDIRAELLKEYPSMASACNFFNVFRKDGKLKKAIITAVKHQNPDKENMVVLTKPEAGFFKKKPLTPERLKYLIGKTFGNMILMLDDYNPHEKTEPFDFAEIAIAGCITRLGQLCISVMEIRGVILPQAIFDFIKACNEHRDLVTHNDIHDKTVKFNPLDMNEIMRLARQGKDIWLANPLDQDNALKIH